MKARSKTGTSASIGILFLLVVVVGGAGCGWRPWRIFVKDPVQVRLDEAFGDRHAYHVTGTLVHADGRPVTGGAPIRLMVTLGPATLPVETDENGRLHVRVTAADFQRAELPGGETDLIFRLAGGEDRRCRIRFPEDGEQRDVVHINGEQAPWAVVVILHAIPMTTAEGGWMAPAVRGAYAAGSPAHLGAVLRFLRHEARPTPPRCTTW